MIREQKEHHAWYIMRLNQQQDSGETEWPASNKLYRITVIKFPYESNI